MKIGKKIKTLIKDSPIVFAATCFCLIALLFENTENQKLDIKETSNQKQNVFATWIESTGMYHQKPFRIFHAE